MNLSSDPGRLLRARRTDRESAMVTTQNGVARPDSNFYYWTQNNHA
jgi:hypothetical protein